MFVGIKLFSSQALGFEACSSMAFLVYLGKFREKGNSTQWFTYTGHTRVQAAQSDELELRQDSRKVQASS